MSAVRIKYSKITHKQTDDLIKLFVAGSTARSAADVVGVNRHTATIFFHKIREKIAAHQEQKLSFYGEVEVDESYFGGKRKGKRGRGAAGKIPVFGILKRNGKVFTCTIKDAKKETLIPIIKKKVQLDSIVYSDTFRSYDSLNVEGYTSFT
jgi:transposase